MSGGNGNPSPIYSKVGDIQWATTSLTTQAADYTGASACNITIFTANTNGGYLQRLRFKAGSANNIATVARVYICNSTVNGFYGEISLPATFSNTTSSTPEVDYILNAALPPNYSVKAGLGATVVGGWWGMGIGGQY